ncbi:MAG TPA: hypothetical protein VKB88_00665 [Bryobacteraceae bacterium]|nr:hypothetical protein [Bryobacteraceae bacterium]
MKFHILSALLISALPAQASEADFGMIGVTSFETARLNAFCDGSVVPAPCDVTFEFHDLRGGTLKQASLVLQPETTGFLDFSLATAASVANRVEIIPCIKVLRGTAQPSLELLENVTHRTRLLITWGSGAVARSNSDVDFGAAGITPFDTARMGASCQGDSTDAVPCDVTFEFHDASGSTLKSARMAIAPGAAAYLDLTFANTAASSGRVTIDPCWTVASGAAVLDLQILDTFSGFTLSQGYPASFARLP